MEFFKRYRRISRQKTLSLTETLYEYSGSEIPVFGTCELGELKEGVAFKISGYMPPNCESFAIELILGNATSDIALLVNVRLPQQYIVRNSRLHNHWGIEESASEYPMTLMRGSLFVIKILITDFCYMISLNGNHFAKFLHRVPYQSLACIRVLGDVLKVNVERIVMVEYPDRSPELVHIRLNRQKKKEMPKTFSHISLLKRNTAGLQLPYYGVLPEKKFGYGYHLRLEGRVKVLPWSFYINLQCGQNVWPHPIIAMHFCCIFSNHRGFIGKNVVALKAWIKGHWNHEEVSPLSTDLCPAQSFSLLIVRRLHSYEVYVNKKFVATFRFSIYPEIVDTVCVLGDIKLWDVILDNDDVIPS